MNKPIPSTEAVEAFAREAHDDYERKQPNPVLWDELSPVRQQGIRVAILPPLVEAYPQIVADILNAYADETDDVDEPFAESYALVGHFLRAKATEALS